MTEFGGRPLFARKVAAVASATAARRLIVLARKDRLHAIAAQPWVTAVGVTVARGGFRRQDWVAVGVDVSAESVALRHDRAGPLVTSPVVDRVAGAALERGVAVPNVPAPDDARRVKDRLLVWMLEKPGLFPSQTPHGARRDLLLSAGARQDPGGPETSMEETTLGRESGLVASTAIGDPVNVNVTLRGDEELAFAACDGRARAAAADRELASQPPGSPVA